MENNQWNELPKGLEILVLPKLPIMDLFRLWKKLPRELEIQVLAKLPILDLFRLSVTCKYFHSLLLDRCKYFHSLLLDPSFAYYPHLPLLVDPSFAILSHRNRVGYPMLFVISSTEVSECIIWQEAGRHVTFTWKNPFACALRLSDWHFSSYGDGFVCYRKVTPPYLLKVLNPLFPHEHRTFTLPLPAMPDRVTGLHTGIAYDRKNRVCKLVLWRNRKGIITSFVYNFKEGTWKNMPEWKGIHGSYYFHCNARFLLHDRFLCWFVVTGSTVLVFDVEEDSWIDPLPFLPTPWDDKLFLCVFEYKKQLCLMRKIDEKAENLNFGLWKFDIQKSIWKMAELIQAPPLPASEINNYAFQFFGIRDLLLCIRLHLWIYDTTNQSWLGLPELTPRFFEATLFRLMA